MGCRLIKLYSRQALYWSAGGHRWVQAFAEGVRVFVLAGWVCKKFSAKATGAAQTR